MNTGELVVLVSLSLLLYAYFGYPLLLHLVARSRRSRHTGVTADQVQFQPSVTVVFAARNEEAVIAQKLDNILAQNYPAERLDVVVISDGSTDRTDEIVEAYVRCTNRVILLQSGGRRGKSASLNLGMQAASGEMIVLTDANAMFKPDAISRLVAPFCNSQVGAVSGQLRYTESGRSASGEGVYWRYEQWIKKAESALRSLLGANGSIYAIRRSLFHPLKPRDVDDFRIPYEVLLQGHQVVLEPEAVSFEDTAGSLWSEYRRKVRIMATAIPMMLYLAARTLLAGRLFLLWQLVSHKLLREIQGILFLIMLFGAAWAGWKGSYLMLSFLALQSALYLLGVIGWVFGAARFRPLRLVAHFDMIALASVAALWLWVSGGVKPTWEPERAAD